MTRYEAYIKKDWQDSGQAYVVAVRLRDNGVVELSALLLDTWCLGVKDAVFVDDYTEGEYRDALKNHLPDDDRQPIHPAYAKKLIEGAVEYAQQFGFAPHRDYKKTRRVFNGVDAAACTEDFIFGKNGKPMFIAGESDTPERIQRVLTMLEARCGKNGFHYVCRADEGEDFDDEDNDGDDAIALREDLMDWFDGEPDSVPGFYEVSGLITAMQLCPQVIMPTKLFEVLWGPKGRKWKNQTEVQEFSKLLMGYWNQVSELVMESLDPSLAPAENCMDVYTEDFEADDPESLTLALSDWAAGFVRATEYWPEAWAETLARPDFAPHWEILRCVANISSKDDALRLEKMKNESPPRVLGSSVATITRALRQTR